MTWELDKMLKEIDDYFDNVTPEEFEKDLEKAGCIPLIENDKSK
jgi:hypothetical protein